ncbi:hypothetical protein [Psychromonas antarctica]|uniref:hypothetical protein n=1 Tax=Psychromonas antarctica TaxID=67573 RepID=UPI001EE9214B|nr:hypothetical protein [Psychromonas antarctica]MCG6200001.1 hypothetical protein [Psychromonas antarctica]
MKIKLLLVFCMSLLVVACGDDRPAQLKSNIQRADYLVENLGQNLDTNAIRNTSILREYAKLLAQEKPDLKPLLGQLSRDASRDGPMYQGLQNRLKTVKEQPQVLGDIEAQLYETENLIAAADAILFNDALSDPINVIADMSEGKLARVNAISKQRSLQANGAEDNGAGSQLVGNPGYGSWQSNSSGGSFWQWYGMYAMFSALSPRRVQYDRWSSRRDYSYYNDYGRNRYTSPQQAKSQDNLAKKTNKQFANKGGFKSPYAKSKTGASRMSSSSQQAQKSAPFSGKSSFSRTKSSSSFRNSKSTSSRGISRGK